MSPDDLHELGWLPAAPNAPPKNRIRSALIIATTAILVGGGITAVAWIVEPDAKGFNLSVGLRAIGTLSGFILLLVARALAKPTHPRLGTLFAGIAVLGLTGLLDAIVVAAQLATWVRNLSFALAGALAAALLLGLLRRPGDARGKDSLLAFLSDNWLYVGLLAFLIIARIGIDGPISEILPDLITNGLFLLLFLSILFRLVTRYLRRFGSPISWNEGRHHQQQVDTFADPHMDEVRGVLQRFIDRGEAPEAYETVMRTAAERIEAFDVPIDAMLKNRPGPIAPGVRAVPAPHLLGASACLAAAVAALIAVFPASAGVGALTVAGWFLLGFGASLPLMHGGVKAAADPGHPMAWAIGAASASLGVLLVNAVGGFYALLLPLLPILFYGPPAARLFLRAHKLPEDAIAARAEQAARARRDSVRALIGAGAITAALVLYPIIRSYTRGVTPLPPISGPWLAGLVAIVAFLTATFVILGPAHRAHRQRLDRLQAQEKSQRAAYHLRILQTLEGART